jgi:hypothetical protein
MFFILNKVILQGETPYAPVVISASLYVMHNALRVRYFHHIRGVHCGSFVTILLIE